MNVLDIRLNMTRADTNGKQIMLREVQEPPSAANKRRQLVQLHAYQAHQLSFLVAFVNSISAVTDL
jgi:hypothetical protein